MVSETRRGYTKFWRLFCIFLQNETNQIVEFINDIETLYIQERDGNINSPRRRSLEHLHENMEDLFLEMPKYVYSYLDRYQILTVYSSSELKNIIQKHLYPVQNQDHVTSPSFYPCIL